MRLRRTVRRRWPGARLVGRQFHRQRKILPRQRKILPRVTLNLGTRLSSVGVGRRGARVSAGKRETTATLSLIGTGLAYGWHRKRRSRKW